MIKDTLKQNVVFWSKCFFYLGNELAEKKLRREVGIPSLDIVEENSEHLDRLWVPGTQSLGLVQSCTTRSFQELVECTRMRVYVMPRAFLYSLGII